MPFAHIEVAATPLAGEPPELRWLEGARAGRSRAVLWEAPPGLSVPRSYGRFPHLGTACAEFAARGLPVYVRATGGGVVPQGPGILNLSLAWRPRAGPADGGTDDAYRLLCAVLVRALAAVGIAARAAPVAGSFCDGRYNLAVDGPAGPRKIVGTAQCWRRRDGIDAVLAHALLLVQTDNEEIAARASAFEAALGTTVRYTAEAITDVAHEWQRAHPGATAVDLRQQVVNALLESLAQAEVAPEASR